MLRALLGLLFMGVFVTTAAAEKRVALVIGNGLYQNVTPLNNPTNDAALVAETLKSLGFSIVGGSAQLNLDKSALDKAVQQFGQEVQGADVAMFYYAGHGVQVRGANFLVPINANPAREADVDFQMTDLNLVLNQMQGSGTRLNLVVLDACRNNPFGARGLRATEGGLAQVRAPEGTLISYATQPGNVALDGRDGHSPYTKALADTMTRPGLDIFQTFNQVGLSVKRATGGAQQPWVSSSPIDGSFYFSGGAQAPAVAKADRSTTETPRQEARLHEAARPIADDITDCDRLASNDADANRVRGVPGIRLHAIDIVPALAACNAAMAQHPDVPRFVYLSGRIAQAQRDYGRARDLYEKAAAANYPIAYHGRSLLYAYGNGVPRDFDQARQSLEKGIALNDPDSMHFMGYLYEMGWGEPKDAAIARQWYGKADAAGSVAGTTALARSNYNGFGGPKDFAKARILAERAAAAGDPSAMSLLGLIHQNGNGVAVDLAQALRWYQRSADGGDAAGMNNLGHLYLNGRGVAKDYAQAKVWLDKAAAAGRPSAMAALGTMYLNGYGVTQDPAQARSWFEKGAAAGDAGAVKALAQMDEAGKR